MARTKYTVRRSVMTLKVLHAKRCKPLCDFCQSRFSLKSLRFSTLTRSGGETKCYHLKCLFRTSIFPRTTSEIKNFNKLNDNERLEIENLIAKTISDLPNIQIPPSDNVVSPIQNFPQVMQILPPFSQPSFQQQQQQQSQLGGNFSTSIFSSSNVAQNNWPSMPFAMTTVKQLSKRPKLPLVNQQSAPTGPIKTIATKSCKYVKFTGKCQPIQKPATFKCKKATKAPACTTTLKVTKQPKQPKALKVAKIPKIKSRRGFNRNFPPTLTSAPNLPPFHNTSSQFQLNTQPSITQYTSSTCCPNNQYGTLSSTSGSSTSASSTVTPTFGTPGINNLNSSANSNPWSTNNFGTNNSLPKVSGFNFKFGTPNQSTGLGSQSTGFGSQNTGFGSQSTGSAWKGFNGFGQSSGSGTTNKGFGSFGNNGNNLGVFSYHKSNDNSNVNDNNTYYGNKSSFGWNNNNFGCGGFLPNNSIKRGHPGDFTWPSIRQSQDHKSSTNLNQSQDGCLFPSNFVQLYIVCDQLSKLNLEAHKNKRDYYTEQEGLIKIYRQMPIDYEEIFRLNYGIEGKYDSEISSCIAPTVIDAMIYGMASGCPMCGGKLMFHEGEYGCMGDHNGALSCIFTTTLPKRTKLILDGKNEGYGEMFNMPLKYRIHRDEVPIHRLDINTRSVIFSEDVLPGQIDQIEGCGYILAKSVNDADICISSGLNPYDRIQQTMIRRHKPIVNIDYFNNKNEDILNYCMMYTKENQAHVESSIFQQSVSLKTSILHIDPDSGYSVDNQANLYNNNGKIYSVKLGLKNSYVPNYVKMQIIEHDNKYNLYVKYYDDTKTNRTIIEQFNTNVECQSRFEQLYCDLTLVKYDDIDTTRNYTLYQPIQVDNQTLNMTNITQLLRHILSKSVYQQTLNELSPVASSLLSSCLSMTIAQVLEVVASQIRSLVLNDQPRLIDVDSGKSETLTARGQLRIWEFIRDVMAIDSLCGQHDDLTNLDIIYDKMNCDINFINKSDSRYLKIQNYIDKTGGDNIYFSAKITNLYSVVRHEDILKDKKSGSRKLLWFGLYDSSVAHYLINGFQKPQNNIPDECYPNGRSIKLYDMFCRSLGYCQDMNKKCYLLLCDVYLGNVFEFSRPDEISQLPSGYDSAKLVGKVGPNYSQTYDIDGLSVPGVLDSKNQADSRNLMCTYDEYLIYNTTNITIKYLVEVELK